MGTVDPVKLDHNSLDLLQVLREPTSCLNPGPLPGCDGLRGEGQIEVAFLVGRAVEGDFQDLFGAGDKAVDIMVCVPHILTHPVQRMGEAGYLLERWVELLQVTACLHHVQCSIRQQHLGLVWIQVWNQLQGVIDQ